MDDVAVDAKRILLRYGAPIDILDDVSELERIELARLVAKTSLADRERQLRQELADRGYMEPPPVKTRKKRSRARASGPATGRSVNTTPSSPGLSSGSTKTPPSPSKSVSGSSEGKSIVVSESPSVEPREAKTGDGAKKNM